MRQRVQDAINKFRDKQDQATIDPGEDLFAKSEGRIFITYLKYYDRGFQFADTITPQTGYVTPCLEPDFNLLKCWLPLQTIKGNMVDASGFNNIARFRGVPRVSTGIKVNGATTLETAFDGRTNYIEIVDDPSDETNIPNPNIQINSLTTGFTCCFRFKPFEVTRANGIHLPLVYKFDYTSNNWLWFFIDGATSKLTMYVKKGGNFYSTIYNTALTANTRYEVTFSFDSVTPGNRKLYINGANQTTLNSPTAPDPPWTTTLNMMLGRSYPLVAPTFGNKYPDKSVSGLYYGTLQDFRWWKEKVATSTEASALYTNKATFYNLAAGTPALVNTSFVRT